VKIYGGFAGTESSLSERDLTKTEYTSTINGDDRSFAIYISGVSRATLLDGFTVTGGSVAGIHSEGCSPTLANLILKGNGYNIGVGGFFAFRGYPLLINVTITGNSGIAALYNYQAAPDIVNCAIVNNSVKYGSVYNVQSEPLFINCTIAGGKPSGAEQTFGIYQYLSSSKIYNCIVSGRDGGINDEVGSDIKNSLVYGELLSVPGGGFSTNPFDPLFVDPEAGNYRLQRCSPAVNGGSNIYNAIGYDSDTTAITTDLDRKPRFREHIVDIGAYEFSGASRGLAANLDEASANITRDYVLTNSDCRLVAYLNPNSVGNGTGAVSGQVSAKVWVANSQPANFVKRHYEITPSINAASATAQLTLFFTQQEFDNFNAVNTLKLPLNAADAENYNANLRIEKRAGTSNDGSGLPDSYTGSITTFKPSEVNGKVEWNADAQYWEVTFNVTGFSGFFVKTTESALPLNLISFTATKDEGSNLLQWSTASEVNTDNFEVQSSIDAKRFTMLAVVNANGSGNNAYSYIDRASNNGTIYYRLKMSDLDGTYTFSKIISVKNGGELATIYPNPAGETATFHVNNALLKTTANLYDVTGRHIQSVLITTNKQQINTKSLPSGLYILKFADGTVERLMKN
jgi:hypothetical protein